MKKITSGKHQRKKIFETELNKLIDSNIFVYTHFIVWCTKVNISIASISIQEKIALFSRYLHEHDVDIFIEEATKPDRFLISVNGKYFNNHNYREFNAHYIGVRLGV